MNDQVYAKAGIPGGEKNTDTACCEFAPNISSRAYISDNLHGLGYTDQEKEQ